MAPHEPRPSLSITLPPSFEFHYNDGQMPKTPDRQEQQQPLLNPPPPPRPHAFKVRRKRATIPEFQESELLMSDTPIPTIEMSEAASVMSSPTMQPMSSAHGLLAPMPAFQRLVTPPKTPAPRTYTNFSSPVESPANEWALINDSRSKLKTGCERSGSICSSFSDSSVSSCGSSAFSAPNNGSCTSPESEATDPFLEDDVVKTTDKAVTSPDLHSSSPIAKRIKTHRHIKWTQAMDDHLWMTYMQYLADPRVTPFKMLPGTTPPLGVCSRVASKARRTWSSHRTTTLGLDTIMSADRMQREGSPDTIRPEAKEVKQPQWPRSDSNTRRRLRSLCKRKPSLSAHYQRLLLTRSPSPFASSSSVDRTSEPPQSAFASRDMKMSLVTATAPSMQPQGPLAQLTSDELPRPQSSLQAQRESRPADWFARIPRSQAHHKSLSLQSGLSLNTMTRPAGFLASPFDDIVNRSHMLDSMSTTKSLGRTAFNKDGKAPSLNSPVELSGAPTMPRSLKRRFRSDEDKPKRLPIEDVFGPQAEDSGIVRNRGFTVGAVRATDNLARLFTPPVSAFDQEMTEAPPVPALPDLMDLGPSGSRSVPRRLAEPVPRLGSPFTETPNRQFNTFPRSYIPSTSNPAPFQRRLRELAAHGIANQSG
ncbi:hypothetical protein LTR36_008638 [Oleoguttula mirabilis]|uniref:Uncharacterized protein n=1 Tax=Oleoguttula mirabilis TaxID=1507867 RepID=A0AAV9JUB5_9PEZI|nr:hypothetical protein LTR36_008638 [Oleoguttula mirabilis]